MARNKIGIAILFVLKKQNGSRIGSVPIFCHCNCNSYSLHRKNRNDLRNHTRNDGGADPGFPTGGAPTPEEGAKTYYLANFFPKTE